MTIRELADDPSLPILFGKAVLTGFGRRGDRLPSTVYRRVGVMVDAERMAAYNRVCGFRLSDELPVTYPHVLAFPLQVKLMTDRDFPFPLVGSVHLANRISRTRPLRRDERLDLRVHAENLRPHAKGRQFDVISEVMVDGEVVWRDISTYLRLGGGNGEPDDRGRSTPRQPPQPTAVWHVPADVGRRYAEVSGDHNPIHLHALAARPFGFRGAIAHGMWTKARCLAAFDGRLPDAYTVDVRFQRPVPLPSEAGFAIRDGGPWFDLFELRTGKPYLEGLVRSG